MDVDTQALQIYQKYKVIKKQFEWLKIYQFIINIYHN